MAATAAALAGREFSVDVPFSVSEAGDDAELEWLAAFRENFQTPSNTARRPAVQEISNVPLQQSKKKRKQSTEPLVGVPGLMTSQARDVVTKVSTKTVRESFYLPPPEDCKEGVATALYDTTFFTFTEQDFEQWWETSGWQQVKASAKSCRYYLTRRVKEGLFTSYGTRT